LSLTLNKLAVNTLRITQWNANGLANHKPELHQFLRDPNTDILLISETHFTDRTVFKLPGYSTYHCNHPDGTAHGGAAILIRTTLQNNEAPINITTYEVC
jgi:exonuclease III